MRSVIPALTLLLFFIGCGKKEQSKIIITGSSTVAPITAAIAMEFEKQHPNSRVDVQSGGSSRGIADLKKNLQYASSYLECFLERFFF